MRLTLRILLAAFFVGGMIFCAFGFCVLLCSVFAGDHTPKIWDDEDDFAAAVEAEKESHV